MKLVVNILLIIVFLAVSIGHIFIFSYQEYSIKKEMKRALLKNMPDAELTTLVIAKSKLNPENGFNLIHSREFKYLGEMYDIVREIQLTDSIKYICIHDKDETALINNFVKYSNSDKNNPPIKKKSNQINLDNYDIIENATACLPSISLLYHTNIDDYMFNLSKPDSPPPKISI